MSLINLFESTRQPLFHGTALLNALCIMYQNRIDSSTQYPGQPEGISLTRDYRTAREFATYWERLYPVVLCFDWDKLRTRHKILPYVDYDPQGNQENSPWPARREGGVYRPEEHEEVVFANSLSPVDKYLISINVDPAHLVRATSNKEYLYWMFDEYSDMMHTMKIRSRKELGRRIEIFAKHPLINKWTPRVSVVPGKENDGYF